MKLLSVSSIIKQRIGVLVMIAFLETNNISLACSNEELIAFGLAIADSTLSFPAIKDWILQHT
jgi:prophage maintenance system killer protein